MLFAYASSRATECRHHGRLGIDQPKGDEAEAVLWLQEVQLQLAVLTDGMHICCVFAFEQAEARIGEREFCP